jgi:hypothetical protein
MPAIPFIVCCPVTGKYTVTDKSIEMLSSLSSKQLGVIALAGKYRTGKSFFLNRVLLQRNKGFHIGSSVNACTKGVWLYTETIKASNGLDVLVLDTEGIGSLEADSTHDSRIFAFAVLLSSLFVYNSVGSIDESALQTLSLVTNISKQIRVSQDKEPTTSDLSSIFPSFCWVVRDFSLRLENSQGDSINADTYLESALCPSNQSDNDVKQCISDCFPDRSCVTMVRPCQEETDLQNLENMENQELRPVFVQQMSEIRDKLMSNIKVKDYLGHGVTGTMLASLAQQYTASINEGAAPVIKNAWQLLTEIQGRELLESSWNKFKELVDHIVKGNRDPCGLREELTKYVQECLDYFDKNLMEPSLLKQQLVSRMESLVAETIAINKQILNETLDVEITNLSQELMKCDDMKTALSEIVKKRDLWMVENCEYTDNLWNKVILELLWKHVLTCSSNMNQRISLLETENAKLESSRTILESRLIEKEQEDLQWKKRSQITETQLSESTQALEECNLEQEQLKKIVEDLENRATVDVTLQLQLSEAQQERDSIEKKLIYQQKCLEESESSSQIALESLRSQALTSLTQFKNKNKEITNQLTKTRAELEEVKQGFQTATKCLSDENVVLKSSERTLNTKLERLNTDIGILQSTTKEQQLQTDRRQEEYYKEHENNSKTIMELKMKVKELEAERTCEVIHLKNCKKRLAEVEAASNKHKKLKIELHRSDTEMEKHKSLVDWLTKDKIIKEKRIVELQTHVNEIEKRCNESQKQYELDMLRMKLITAQ